MTIKTKLTTLPRSTLRTLHEPLINSKDGHGARSSHDVMVLKLWEVAKTSGKEADAALAALINLITREDLVKLKGARGQTAHKVVDGEPYKLRSLVPVMTLLGMITSETVSVPAERDGLATVTSRRKIGLAGWFECFAFERKGVDQGAVESVTGWLAGGGLQRPFRQWYD